MTELYHGPWDPVTGDRPGKVKDDPYHPVYPAATEIMVRAGNSRPVVRVEQTNAQPK